MIIEVAEAQRHRQQVSSDTSIHHQGHWKSIYVDFQ